jgi:hypothetical protein
MIFYMDSICLIHMGMNSVKRSLEQLSCVNMGAWTINVTARTLMARTAMTLMASSHCHQRSTQVEAAGGRNQ